MYKVVPIEALVNYIPYPGQNSPKWAVMVTNEWPSPAIGNTKIDHRSPGPQSAASYMIGGQSYAIVSTHPTKGSADKALRKLKSQAVLPKDDVDRPYQLSLTERQAQVLTEALDLFSRIGMGQLEEIAYVLRSYTKPSESSSLLSSRLDELKRLAREASNVWMGSPCGCRGISSEEIGDAFRVAWDLHQVIRYRLAWDRNPNGGLQVSFDTPMKYSQEPLAIIKKV